MASQAKIQKKYQTNYIAKYITYVAQMRSESIKKMLGKAKYKAQIQRRDAKQQ